MQLKANFDHSAFLGIDVGGTDVKLGMIGSKGNVIREIKIPTSELRTPTNVFRRAIQFANESLLDTELSKYRLVAVGLAVPGVLDTQEHVIREVVNLNGWLGVRLRDELENVCKLPSTVTNDANAAAYAEHSLRGLGHQSLALVTLGTGVGCGMVIAGEPYGGDHGCAGELGHITIDFSGDALPCTCGSRGHLETYAGSAGVVSRMRGALQAAESAGLKSQWLKSTDGFTPRELAEGAEQGDALCLEVITQTGILVGRAIGLLGQTVDPAVVLLGGAMTFGGEANRTGRKFLQTVRETVSQTTLVQVGENIMIDFATLGNQAGVIGAAMVARHHFQVNHSPHSVTEQ